MRERSEPAQDVPAELFYGTEVREFLHPKDMEAVKSLFSLSSLTNYFKEMENTWRFRL